MCETLSSSELQRAHAASCISQALPCATHSRSHRISLSPFYRCCCSWWWAHGTGISKCWGLHRNWVDSSHQPPLGSLQGFIPGQLVPSLNFSTRPHNPRAILQLRLHLHQQPLMLPSLSFSLITPSRLQSQYHLWNFKLQNQLSIFPILMKETCVHASTHACLCRSWLYDDSSSISTLFLETRSLTELVVH